MIKTGTHRVNRDTRGWITTGSKGKSAKGKDIPKSLDHFNVSAFPEIVQVYGEAPQSLTVICPANTIVEFFDDMFRSWGLHNTCKRQCDGIECVHRIKESVNGTNYEQSEITDCICVDLPEDSKERCSYGMVMRMFISHPDRLEYLSPVCYGFRTGSINSGQSVRSELQKMEWISKLQNHGEARLAGVPLRLTVRMVSGKDNANQKFPIWSMEAMSFELPSLPEPQRLLIGSGGDDDYEIVNDDTGDSTLKALEEPKREEAKKEESTAPARPWKPEDLKARLVKSAAVIQCAIDKGEFSWKGHAKPQTPEESRQSAITALGNVGIKDTDLRHAFNQWAFGESSQSKLLQGANEALFRWVGATAEKIDPTDPKSAVEWVPCGDALEEARLAIRHVRTLAAASGNALPIGEVKQEDILGDGLGRDGLPLEDVSTLL